MGKRNVVIGYVHPYTVTEPFARSLAEACLPDDTPVCGIIAASSPRQTVARNEVIKHFLDGPGEWLMWIDTDMSFKPDAINKLRNTAVRNKVKQVGGAGFIFKRQEGVVDVAAFNWDPKENMFTFLTNYKQNSVSEVDATGSGFVLIHREVFEWWRDQYGDTWHQNWIEHPTGNPMGHDLAFFYRTTVEGPFRLLYSTEVTTGHVKSYEITEAAYFASQGIQP